MQRGQQARQVVCYGNRSEDGGVEEQARARF
jgi:hypothetical protein